MLVLILVLVLVLVLVLERGRVNCLVRGATGWRESFGASEYRRRPSPGNVLKICEIGGICGSNFGIWTGILFSLSR